MLDVAKISQDFPILEKKIHGKRLVYLDNAATSQKPRQVIEAISNYYLNHNANVHRGLHQLSDESTQVWMDSRGVVAKFFGATADELIVTRNTTEALNGVAYGWGDHNLKEGDVILSSLMEHHSNLVTWQELCKRTGARLELVKVDEFGRLDLVDLRKKIEKLPVKLVAFVHVSNTLGTRNPIETIIPEIRKKDARIRVVVDGAQAASHIAVDFHALEADFYSVSAHKMLGPMGVGGLFVKKSLLASGEMQPWLFGGGMIDQVAPESTTFSEDLSDRFSAGTPDVASMVGWAQACEYVDDVVGMKDVVAHDKQMVEYALEKLSENKHITLIGPTKLLATGGLDRVGSVAFLYNKVHAHDVAQVLDSAGVAVRSGHHCTMPLHKHFGWQATVRASFQVYNSTHDIDVLASALQQVAKVFSV